MAQAWIWIAVAFLLGLLCGQIIYLNGVILFLQRSV